jgi:hypothetical protein
MAQAAVARPAVSERATGASLDVAPRFPDVVWAHHQWEKSRREGDHGDPRLDEAFRRSLMEFEQEYGRLISVYWSRSDASAVGVTVKGVPTWRRLLSTADERVLFHRATDWATGGVPAIPDALNDCETIASKVTEVLRGTPAHVAMQWIFSIASHLLGYVERTGASDHRREAQTVAHDARLELREVEEYYDRAGTKTGRIVYASGMVFGIFGLVVLGFAAAGVLWLFNAYAKYESDIQLIFACYAAGAIGAIVSVMSRMASPRNAFFVDYEVGRPALRFVGSFRPLLGAIFGLVLFFAVKGQLLQIKPPDVSSFYWYTVLAFVAGFSERFTKVLVDSAEGAVPGARSSSRRRPREAPARKDAERRMDENGA